MNKTNVIRLLEANKIGYDIREYEFNPEEIDAVSVSKKIREKPDRVFKTLVARGDKSGICVFVIPGNFSLNLKKGAKSSGNKKIEMVKEKELLPLTGYIKGGCSPIGMKKLYTTFIDETAEFWETIFVSAGIRGMQIEIATNNLKLLVSAQMTNLI